MAGYAAKGSTSPVDAIAEIVREKPDCVLVDLMMPELDGLSFCHQLRQHHELDETKIVVLTGKTYDFDRSRALALGASGYIVKPFRPELVAQLEAILAGRVELKFWGVRGTLPVPGRQSLRYGGNTSCLTLSPGRDRLFILDGGTGIKKLSDELMARKKRVSARIFLSHPHWDHINALPYFAPFYVKGNEFEVLGASHGPLGVEQLFRAQMEGVFFPVTMREFGARVTFRDLKEQSFEVDGVAVQTMLLSHPGVCLGYRFAVDGKSICYVTDNELFPEDVPEHNPQYLRHLAEFVGGADLLVTDTTYTDEGYRTKIGWGHSSVGAVVRLAHEAGVKELCLFHHDPDQTDDDIDAKFASAQERLAALQSRTRCRAPREGDTIIL
jgi:phosphoribosyl 1,2-cyclic phosphodiesterase